MTAPPPLHRVGQDQLLALGTQVLGSTTVEVPLGQWPDLAALVAHLASASSAAVRSAADSAAHTFTNHPASLPREAR